MTKEQIPNGDQGLLIKKILDTIGRQKFADWYSGDYQKWLDGDKSISTERIKEDVIRLFHLENLWLTILR